MVGGRGYGSIEFGRGQRNKGRWHRRFHLTSRQCLTARVMTKDHDDEKGKAHRGRSERGKAYPPFCSVQEYGSAPVCGRCKGKLAAQAVGNGAAGCAGPISLARWKNCVQAPCSARLPSLLLPAPTSREDCLQAIEICPLFSS